MRPTYAWAFTVAQERLAGGLWCVWDAASWSAVLNVNLGLYGLTRSGGLACVRRLCSW